MRFLTLIKQKHEKSRVDIGYQFTHPHDLRFNKNNSPFLLAKNIFFMPLRKVLLFPHFTDGETEAEDDKVVCSRTGSQQKKNQHQSPGVSEVH